MGSARAALGESGFQITLEGSDLRDLLHCGGLFEVLQDEKGLFVSPNYGSYAAFGEQTGCSYFAEIVLDAVDESGEAIPMEDEVTGDLGKRQQFYVGVYELLELLGHYILYRPRSSSFKPSSHLRSSSLCTFSFTVLVSLDVFRTVSST